MESIRSQCPPAVVLIEDDPGVRLMLTRHLERSGWNVRSASSIAAARAVLREAEWDLVLLDRGLPDGDGLALCSEIRARSAHGYIMVLTGQSSDEAKLQGFNVGADDYVTKPFKLDELMARVRSAMRIVQLQKALIESNRQLAELSLTDGLTRLRNRRAFDNEIAARFEQARRYTRPLSVAIVDVDHFKSVNDERGHQEGDAVLKLIAQILQNETRQADFVARYGGEEFGIILPETPLFDAMQFAEKIREAVADQTMPKGDVRRPVTISTGIASLPHSTFSSAEELIHAADQALYRAKQNGRNRVEIERRRHRFAMRPSSRRLARPATG